MKIIVCLDDKNGMAFNKRRQSQDSVLRQKISELCKEAPIYMSSYSATQFNGECNIVANDNFLTEAPNESYCFIENETVDPQRISELYIFKWNRKYPADLTFNFIPQKSGFKLIKTEDFKGSSHEKITLMIYERK